MVPGMMLGVAPWCLVPCLHGEKWGSLGEGSPLTPEHPSIVDLILADESHTSEPPGPWAPERARICGDPTSSCWQGSNEKPILPTPSEGPAPHIHLLNLCPNWRQDSLPGNLQDGPVLRPWALAGKDRDICGALIRTIQCKVLHTDR